MYLSGQQSGYAPAQTQNAGFQTGGFVPASSLSGGTQNPFAASGFPSQAVPSNPFQSSFPQTQSSHFPPATATASFPTSIPQSAGFPPTNGFPKSQSPFQSSFPTQSFPTNSGISNFQTASKGTAKFPYKPAFDQEGMQTLSLSHVTSMAQYSEKSTEELRCEDYQSNRTLLKPANGLNPFQTTADTGTSGNAQRFPQSNPFAGLGQPKNDGMQTSTFAIRSQANAPTPQKTSFSSAAGNPFAAASPFPQPASVSVLPPIQSPFPTAAAPSNFFVPSQIQQKTTNFPAAEPSQASFSQIPQGGLQNFGLQVSQQLPMLQTAAKAEAFQPQAVYSSASPPYFPSESLSAFSHGFRDPLGLSWLFPNGVPEELRSNRPSLYSLPRFSATEELLKTKERLVPKAAEDCMSSLWRRSRSYRQPTKSRFAIDMRPAATAAVFSKKPFKEMKFEPFPCQEGTYALHRATKTPFLERINDGCDRAIGKTDEEEKENCVSSVEKPMKRLGNPPVLSKCGYYTIPQMSDLRQMSSEELRQIRNFTIGNEHGKLVFDGETDVEGLLLDGIVSIEHKAVVLYPEPFPEKPLVGQKLNKSAVVHLYCCLPKSAQVSAMRFELKIRKVCEKNQSEFISYNSATGEWVFRVNHF